MVAKGHDFPDVTLGVVLDADATLRFPDFRAEERTFALIAQLAGRAGRGGHGRVLVQTIAPQARAILAAARHDSEGSWPASSSAVSRSATRRSPTSSGRLRRRGVRAGARGRDGRAPGHRRSLAADGSRMEMSTGPAGPRPQSRPSSVRRRSFASAAGSGRSSSSRRRCDGEPCGPSARPSGA